MVRCLIGHTGFVGGSLLRQCSFDELYNSKSIEDIRGRTFELVACAGAPGVKWKANKEPEKDSESIEKLIECLRTVKTAHLALISTIDVYPSPRDVNEDSPIPGNQPAAYGRNRRRLERFAEEHFRSTIVRLPGLFGPGLKKNVIYDLINENCVDQIDPGSVFQFYNLERLWADVEKGHDRGIRLLNVATEPISVDELARFCFDRVLPPKEAAQHALYDMRSNHAALWGGRNGYLYSKDQVLGEMKRYVECSRARES